MRWIIKLEELVMLVLFSGLYFQFYQGKWGFFLAMFFVPDLSFLFYPVSKKAGTIAYNIAHHRGILGILVLIGYLTGQTLITQIGLIFLAHSTFDRAAGYGLKFFDSFDHTHLGWIGKSKQLNKTDQ